MAEFTPRSTTSALVFGPELFDDQRVERLGDNLARVLMQSGRWNRAPSMLRQFDLVAHKVTMTPSDRTQLIRVEWTPDEALRKGAIFQVVLLGPGARLVDVIRHDTSFTVPDGAAQAPDGDGSFRRTIALRNVAEVVFLSASRDATGSFSLALSRPRQTPVLMATSWNCPSGRFLPFDPRETEWNWMSPDLEVVKDFTRPLGASGTPPETIRLAVRNVGPRDSLLVSETVVFSWKPWAPRSGGVWKPCGDGTLSFLRSVDDHDRARRGDRMTQDTRLMGKQFVQVPAPAETETKRQPYMIRAVLPSSGDRRDQPLVVLGSSHPITGQAELEALRARGVSTDFAAPRNLDARAQRCPSRERPGTGPAVRGRTP
ncbi:hypothetical protein [Elioraea sp.]|uniref:hypothetical protein n=1 Tax=Elioraea sp. TaxID=2185103 RepID=UPI0025BCE5E3|nr:hypothetical protein [Elioraea sp.]